MHGRRMVLAGGVLAAAAIAVVGGFVVVGNPVTVVDRAGTSVAVAPIVVPAPAQPRPAPTLTAQPVTPTLPQTVPAPAPEDVAAPAPEAPVEAAAPAAPEDPAAPAVPPVVDPAAGVTDELQRAREWALTQGWDSQRVDAWLAEYRAWVEGVRTMKTLVDTTTYPSVPESPSFWFGSQREESSGLHGGD